MNSLRKKVMIGLLGLTLFGYNIENRVMATSEKLDFGDINGQVVGTTLFEDKRYGLLCLLYVKNSSDVMSYHILSGDSEYLNEFVNDASIGINVYVGVVGSRAIQFWGSWASVTDVDSVKIWK